MGSLFPKILKLLFVASKAALIVSEVSLRTNSDTLNFNLNLEGFERCALNLVDSDSGLSRSSLDLIQKFAGDNLENPRTLTTLPPYKSTLKISDTYLTSPNVTLSEVCSVNILIQVKGHFLRQVKNIFGARLYDKMNCQIVIYSEGWVRKTDTLINSFDLPIQASVFIFQVSDSAPTPMNILKIYSLCPSCSSA